MKRILTYTIDKNYDGKTIKDFLKMRCRMSSTLIASLKRTEDGIMLNGERRFVTTVLKEFDILTINIHDGKSENIVPVKMDFSIVYEDEDIIIVNKPPHMPTHPSHGNFSNTLANALAYYWGEKNEERIFRAVNRLDKDTSGLMCVAKNAYAHALLCDEIINNELTRRYSAIVCGDIDADGTITAPIMRESDSVIKRRVDIHGQTAVTHYFVKQRYGNYTLIELQLETGRTHQIRVHMSHIGKPLLGDWLYGVENHDIFDRQALHSSFLRLIHPISGKEMIFEADLPEDMRTFLQKL